LPANFSNCSGRSPRWRRGDADGAQAIVPEPRRLRPRRASHKTRYTLGLHIRTLPAPKDADDAAALLHKVGGSELTSLHAAKLESPWNKLQRRSSMSTRKCPFCAEQIQDEARKCKHCGSELPAAPRRTHPGTWAALIGMVLMMGMCFVAIQGSPRRPLDAAGSIAAPPPSPQPAAEQARFGPQDFAIIEQWQPHAASEQPTNTAFGASVVLERDMSKDELVALVRQLGTGRDPHCHPGFPHSSCLRGGRQAAIEDVPGGKDRISAQQRSSRRER
jgi:hypothetical protein